NSSFRNVPDRSESAAAAPALAAPMPAAPTGAPALNLPAEQKASEPAIAKSEEFGLKAQGRAGDFKVAIQDVAQAMFGRDFEEDSGKKARWAFEGFTSLKIDLQADAASATTFRSLGAEPRLARIVIDERRMDAVAWGFALLVALIGVGLTFKPIQ